MGVPDIGVVMQQDKLLLVLTTTVLVSTLITPITSLPTVVALLTRDVVSRQSTLNWSSSDVLLKVSFVSDKPDSASTHYVKDVVTLVKFMTQVRCDAVMS